MSETVLKVKNLKKIYPPQTKDGVGFVAVNDISFELKKGEILGLLGPNGAGKSTTINMLLGILTPSEGQIEYFGRDFHKFRSQSLQHVTFASTYIKMPWRLTVMENLRIYSLLYSLDGQTFEKRIKKLLDYFGVWQQRYKTMNQLSAGQVTRIMLAKAFLPHPKIVLLDEPTASLDPDIAHQVRSFIQQQQSLYNTSILYTSHNMSEVTEVCDRVIFLKNGAICAEDSPERLAESVSQTRLRLRVVNNTSILANVIERYQAVILSQSKSNEYVLELSETKVPFFLQDLSKKEIVYDQISLEKPSLEDFFLKLADVD